jgi:hypothetical protein
MRLSPIDLLIISPGDPEPIDIQETEAPLHDQLEGHYDIDGHAFVYTDRASCRVVTILGYPTTKIAQPCSI